jgi:hypothetical protein
VTASFGPAGDAGSRRAIHRIHETGNMSKAQLNTRDSAEVDDRGDTPRSRHE